MAIAGRTTNCKALNPDTCTQDIGAFVMTYEDLDQKKPSEVKVMSNVKTRSHGEVGVTGWLAIKLVLHNNDYVVAMGVLDTNDKSLIVFRMKNDVDIHTFNVSTKPICNFGQSQLTMSTKDHYTMVVNHCESDELVVYAVANSRRSTWSYKP